MPSPAVRAARALTVVFALRRRPGGDGSRLRRGPTVR